MKGRQEAGLSVEGRGDLFVDDNAPLDNNKFFNVDSKDDTNRFS